MSAGQTNGRTVLGRIVVHDRIQVEADILPRYFNHSSFASLRRQLNYFNFVRLGKGRQRESAYVNEHVVALDDILHLKRRSNSGGGQNCDDATSKEKLLEELAGGEGRLVVAGSNRHSGAPVLDLSFPSSSAHSSPKNKARMPRPKRRRQAREQVRTASVSPRSTSPVENNLISEDERSQDQQQQQPFALDFTMSSSIVKPDDEVIDCCKNLLTLASGSGGWD
jgi:HSF-type DNA-binding